jgi:hypothetical protein
VVCAAPPNRLRIDDAALETLAADNAHLGAVLTSDAGDLQRIATHLGAHPAVLTA